MIELFKHIIQLDFPWLFDQYGTFIYIVLFLVIFIETGLVAFPFLPGDSLLFTAGIFAYSGHLNIAILIPLLFVAAVVGDNINYWVGRKIGIKIFEIKLKNKPIVKKIYLDKTQEFFEKYGVKAIIMARFVPFVRTFAPFSAGIGQMNYSKYLLFDIIGGALWICSLITAGYLLGSVSFIKDHIDLVCLSIILISVAPILLKVLKKKK